MSTETLQINYSNEIENPETTLENFNEDGNDLSCFHILEVLDCLSTKVAAKFVTSDNFYESLFARRMKFIALRLKIENNLEKNDIIIPKVNFYNEKKKFIVTYEGKDKIIILWKNQFDKEFMRLDLKNYEKEDSVESFVIEFIIETLRNNGGELKSSTKVAKLTTILDQNDKNLLAYAVEKRNFKLVQKLLKLSFDVNREIERKKLIEIAWENEDQEIVLELLKANSYYPENFNNSKAFNEIKEFSDISEILHTAIRENDYEKVKEILINNKNQRHFFNTFNISALNFALKCENFEIYKLLYKECKTFGQNESFNKTLNEEFYKRISKLNSDLSLHLPVSHISILLSRTVVPPCNNLTEQLQLIQAAFEKINQISEINLLLQILATNVNLKIHFDFTQKSVIYMDPTNRSTNIRGCYDPDNNSLHIAALDLLNEATKHETHATISHESAHCVLDMIYKNERFPFSNDGKENKEIYMKILEEIEKKYEKNLTNRIEEKEKIIENVFISAKSDINTKIRELIVRVPDILAFYNGNEEKLNKLKTEFKSLFDYWTEVLMPEMRNALPVLQKLSDQRADISFNDLTKSLQVAIKHSFINFQAQKVKFIEIIATDSKIFKSLTSKQLRKIFNGKQYKIGEMNLTCDQYIERRFSCKCKPNPNFIDPRFTLEPEVKEFEEIMIEFIETKLFLLSDHAGAGKSITCKYLAVKLKEKFPNYYVSYIDLKKYIEIYKNNDNDRVLPILLKILKIEDKLEIQLFKELYESGKVILIFDGVDEIAPKYKNFILNLIKNIKLKTKNMQCIATRPQHSKEFEEKFKIISHNLEPLNEEELKEIIEINSNAKNQKFLNEIKKFIAKYQLNNNPLVITMLSELHSKKNILNENFNMYSLYNEMIELKKDIKTGKGELVNRDADIDSKVSVWEVHQIYAVDLILKSRVSDKWRTNNINLEDLQLFKKYKRDKEKWLPEAISRYGLLIIDNWNTRNEFADFVHRTIAEFFVAKFLIENIKEAIEADIDDISEKEFMLRMNILLILVEWNRDDGMKYIYNFIVDYLKIQKVKINLGKRFLNFIEQEDIQKFVTRMINHEILPDNFKFFAKIVFASLKCIAVNERFTKALLLSKVYNNEYTLFKKLLIGHDWGFYDDKYLFACVLNLFDFLLKSKLRNWFLYTGLCKNYSENEFYAKYGLNSETFVNNLTINPAAISDLIREFNHKQICKYDGLPFLIKTDDEKKKFCLKEIQKTEKFSNLLAFINIEFKNLNNENLENFIKCNFTTILHCCLRSRTLIDQIFKLFEKIFFDQKDRILEKLKNFFNFANIFKTFPSRDYKIDLKFVPNLDYFFIKLTNLFTFSKIVNYYMDSGVSILFLSISLNLEKTLTHYKNEFDDEEIKAIFCDKLSRISNYLFSEINFEYFNLFCQQYFNCKYLYQVVFDNSNHIDDVLSVNDAFVDIYKENFIEKTGYKILDNENFIINNLSYDFYDSELFNFLYFLERADIPKDDLENFYNKFISNYYYHNTKNVLDKFILVFVKKFREIMKKEVEIISTIIKGTDFSGMYLETMKTSFEIIEELLKSDRDEMRKILLMKHENSIHPLIIAVNENCVNIYELYNKFLFHEEIIEIFLTKSLGIIHCQQRHFVHENFSMNFKRFLPFTDISLNLFDRINSGIEVLTEIQILAYESLIFAKRIQMPERIVEKFLNNIFKNGNIKINLKLLDLNEDLKKLIKKLNIIQ